ncbi:MAG: hypothetical protein ACRDGH_16765, partial [Candidatus Limnocylindria bacterium]
MVYGVTEKAFIHIGYGEEVKLGPPHVPFPARGQYRKRLPAADPDAIRQILAETSPAVLTTPAAAVSQASVFNRVARRCWEKNFNQLTPEHQRFIKQHCDQVAAEAGWQIHDEGLNDRRWAGRLPAYVRPMQPNYDGMARALAEYLYSGRPAPAQSVRLAGLAAAFDHSVTHDPESLIAAEKWAAILEDCGYETEPREDGSFHPRVVSLPADVDNTMRRALAAVEPVPTRSGPALLLDDVVAAALAAVGLDREQVKPGALEGLLANGPIGRALIHLGYAPDHGHARAWEFEPPRQDNGAQ